MRLDLLTKYAQEAEQKAEPGFKPKDVRWAIVLDSKVGFCGILPLGQSDQKKNPGLTFPKCPDLLQPELIGGSKARSHFLVETASVIGLLKVPTDDTKNHNKHEAFIELLVESGKSLEPLAEIAKLLSNEETGNKIQKAMNDNEVKPTDKVTIQLNGELPVAQDYWHDWWRSYRKSLKAIPPQTEEPSQMRCFISGELIVPLKTHPKIEGLAGVGGQPSGDALIGFDKEAYRSYGLEQSTNAAISEEAGNAYRAGLNELIKHHSQRLAGAKIIHWFKGKIAENEDPLALLIESREQVELNAQYEAKKLLESIKSGDRPDLTDNYFYALTLSGAGGRVMVRDWMEGPFTELVANINQWFADLEIVNRDGDSLRRPPKFIAVLGSLVRELDDLTASTVAKMWRVAVHAEGIPYAFIGQSLARRKIEITQSDEKKPINATGIGLIKAYHIRKYKREGNTTLADSLKPVLNEDLPSPAYQCGRLMAVLAELQRAALGDVGAGIVQRYYAAASTTPALVLGRLTRTSQFHLNKLERGLAYWYESKIAGIWSQLNEAPPRTLSLEDQSLFAMGYYQQLASMRVKKSENTKEEKEATNG